MRRLSARAVLLYASLAVAACSPADRLTEPGMRNAVAPPPPRDPILFVHGWGSTAAVWQTMISRFQADGWTPAELSTWTYNTAQSNVNTLYELGWKIDSLRAATGAAKVDVIVHSMAVLPARGYTRYWPGGDGKVDALVSLAGTNHGTAVAYACFQISCLEMWPNSWFLEAINNTDETWGLVRYATWWSPCDEAMSPKSSALLSGATNTQTACLSHSQLHQDATVYAQVRDFVRQ